MRVISTKPGSTRERTDVQADFILVANWRIGLEAAEPGMLRAQNKRHLVLSSRWGSERAYDLWLTEGEAVAIAKAVMDDLLTKAVNQATHEQTSESKP